MANVYKKPKSVKYGKSSLFSNIDETKLFGGQTTSTSKANTINESDSKEDEVQDHYSARQQANKPSTGPGYSVTSLEAAEIGKQRGINVATTPSATVTVTDKNSNTDKVTTTTPTTTTDDAVTVSPPLTYTPYTAEVSKIGAFEVSDAYKQAMALVNSLQSQLSGGTSYSSRINSLMNEYLNRDDFEYDSSEDVMFQQMLAQAMSDGKVAMQDSIGQASALTGGYGSTYATAVGNNMYNQYVQDAYNNLPEYYQLALDAYNQEGQEMLSQLSLLMDADAQEYQKTVNAYNAALNSANTMYSQEYNAWADSVSMDQWERQYNLGIAEANNNLAYKHDTLNQSQEQWQQEFDWEKEQYALSSLYGGTGYEALSTGEIDKLTNIYIKNGGGESGMKAVDNMLTSMGKNNVDTESLMSIMEAADVPSYLQDWELVESTGNDLMSLFGINPTSSVFENASGERVTYKELLQDIEESDMTDAEKQKAIAKLKEQFND